MLLHLSANAQEPGMWHITDDDGLPSRTVYHTAQDQKGYIWMATEKGICRFDGQKFKVYKSKTLNDSEILKVEIDSFGRVWFRNLSGQLFYIENEIVYSTKDSFPDGLTNVADFSIDDHTLWIIFKIETNHAYQHKLTKLSFDKKGNFTPIYIYDQTFLYFWGIKKFGHSVYFSAQDSDANNVNQFIQVHKSSKNLTIKKQLAQDSKIESSYHSIINEELYISTFETPETSISKVINDKTKKLFSFNKKTIINDLKIFDGQYWLLTSQGLFVKDTLDDLSKKSPRLLINNRTNHLMIDHEGNKWISTTGSGIYVVTAPQTQVIQTTNFNLPNNEIYSLAYDQTKRKLLLGHSKGQISIINKDFENKIISSNPSGRVVDILIDQSGNYWCANENELVVYSSDLIVKKRSWAGVKIFLQATNNDLWIGAFDYAYRIPQKKMVNINNIHISQLIEVALFKRTYALHQDKKDNIWIGTANGLHVYRDTVQPFLENGAHIPYNISSIIQTKDSVIWVATRGDGLMAIKNNKVIQRIKEEDGLASNTTKKIFTTPLHIWVATDNGVNKLDLKSKEIQWINTTDGLPSNDINDIEIVDNKVWIATSKGLANFSVDAKHKNETPPPIYISNIKLEEKDTTVQDSFSLSYDNNSIQIDMIGLGYKGKGNISYQYKLSGMEKNWVYTTSQFVRYPNLPPGEYKFEVFAINEDQVKSSQPASVYFSIQTPWWKTWWFNILCFLSVGVIVALFVNFRIRRQQKEQRFLDHVQALKTKALRSQMNPHFIFNALNAIQRFLTTNDREQAMNYLSNFGKLIRSVFEQSQLELISLEEEIDFLKLYLDLEKLRFMDAITIQLEISPSLQEISDEIHLPPLLIQPIVENSFKHGFLYKKERGLLTIKFSKEGTFLICTVEDNGIGRKKAAELGQKVLKDRPSSGLKTSKERLNILKPNKHPDNTDIEKSQLNFIDLYDAKGDVRGTLVEIKIYCSDLEPIQQL